MSVVPTDFLDRRMESVDMGEEVHSKRVDDGRSFERCGTVGNSEEDIAPSEMKCFSRAETRQLPMGLTVSAVSLEFSVWHMEAARDRLCVETYWLVMLWLQWHRLMGLINLAVEHYAFQKTLLNVGLLQTTKNSLT